MALVDQLRDVAQSLGGGPTGSDVNARAGPCDRTYRNRFGKLGRIAMIGVGSVGTGQAKARAVEGGRAQGGDG